MSHIASFEIKEDDADGTVGFIPKGCYDFNAAIDGSFLFHDVFEHWFENKVRWFSGDAALNPAGEVAAMGARLYNLFTLGFNPLRRSADEYANVKGQCVGDIHESIFGEFRTILPRQRTVFNSDVDDMASGIVKELEDGWVRKSMRENDNRYVPKESEIRDCLRWGWRMASKVIPHDDWEARRKNVHMCHEFVGFWDAFFAEWKENLGELDSRFRQIDIHVTRKKKVVSWKAVFIARYPFNNVTLRPGDDIYYKFKIPENLLEYA
jgi:hypothetical protein